MGRWLRDRRVSSKYAERQPKPESKPNPM